MAVTFERLRARIGCARLVLAQVDCADAKHGFISRTQRDVLEELLRGCLMDPQQRAELVQIVSACNFVKQDLVDLLAVVAGPDKKSRPQAGYKLGQYYVLFPAFS